MGATGLEDSICQEAYHPQVGLPPLPTAVQHCLGPRRVEEEHAAGWA